MAYFSIKTILFSKDHCKLQFSCTHMFHQGQIIGSDCETKCTIQNLSSF